MSVQKLTERDLERGERILEAIYDEVDNRLNPDREECWHCGGEGETHDCIDGCCLDAESGCPDCSRPCPECRINAGIRAKAIRIEVVKSDDVAVAVAWLKEKGRWNDSITLDQVREEIAKARAKLDEPKPGVEIIDQKSTQIGGVTVTTTFGRITPAGRAALKEEEKP